MNNNELFDYLVGINNTISTVREKLGEIEDDSFWIVVKTTIEEDETATQEVRMRLRRMQADVDESIKHLTLCKERNLQKLLKTIDN